MTAKRALYLRIPVSAPAAEIRALKSAGGPMGAERTWYNDCKAGIIPAHTGFCVHRRNPGAKIRRRPMAAERTWYDRKKTRRTRLCSREKQLL